MDHSRFRAEVPILRRRFSVHHPQTMFIDWGPRGGPYASHVCRNHQPSEKGEPMFTRQGRRTAMTLGALAMVVGLAGCAAKVKQEDFNSEVAKLRQEMQ